MSTPQAPRVPEAPSRLPGVGAVVAIGSGKGGVGKSTVAVNLAVTLARGGASVGLLDADIYGPSIPIMMGLRDKRPEMADAHHLRPLSRYGVDAISMGFLLEERDAVAWRGPMLARALQQFIENVEWGTRDFLIVDLPPGTGDVQLSLAQLLPVAGAVVVTTPQDVALADVRRAVRMFEVTGVPVAGVIENMAWYTCPDTGTRHWVFGQGRTEAFCGEAGIELLGRLPLDEQIGPAADQGEPIVVADPEGEQAKLYDAIARKLVGWLAAHAEASTPPEDRFAGFFGEVPSSERDG